MLSWIREHLKTMDCNEITLRKIELACEEALVNIIEHAYKDNAGKLCISLRQPQNTVIELILRDEGPPFNPIEQQLSLNPMATLHERKIGGLGILFMRQYMDEIQYRRENNTNILTLIKYRN